MPSSRPGAAFVLKLCLLLAPFGLGLGWLELRLRALPSSDSQKRAGFARLAPGLDSLVLGASESLQGVDPAALGPRAYSLANVGQSLYYDRQLLAWALPQAPGLRRVLDGISYETLAYSLDRSPEAWRAAAYYHRFGILPQEGWRGVDFRFFSWVLFYEPGASLRWALTGQGLGTPALTASGQDPLPCPPEDLVDIKINALTAAHRAATHEGLIHLGLLDANLGQLRAMAQLARDRHIRLGLFLPPVTQSYAQAIDAGRRALMVAKLKALAQGQGLALKDYFQDPRFHDGDFFDVDHLCQGGAEKFSRILAHDFPLH